MSVSAPQPTWRSVSAYWGPLLVLAAAVPLALLAVHAWRGAGEQRRNAETAFRESCAAALKTQAVSLTNRLNDTAESVHAPIKIEWLSGDSGAPGDWVFGPWPQPESPENRLWEEITEALRAGRKEDAAVLLTKLQSALALKPDAASRSGLPLAVLAAHQEYLLAPERAPLLVRAVREHPSPLSHALLEDLNGKGFLPRQEHGPSLAWANLHQTLRDRLRENRAVQNGAVWIDSPTPGLIVGSPYMNYISNATRYDYESWHIRRDSEKGQLYCNPASNFMLMGSIFPVVASLSPLLKREIPAKEIQKPGAHILALFEQWEAMKLKASAELDGRIISRPPPDSRALIVAEAADGPWRLKLYTTDKTALFRGLDTQLASQRRLIAWAAAFVALALGGLAWVLARQRRLNGMMANFVAAVSHELRSPIASAGLLAERLAQGRVSESEETARYHRLISGECRRLSGLIENVLTFSRIGRGRRDYDFDLADLTELARRSAALLQPRATERSVTIREEFPDKPVEIVIDAPAVQQALLNLLDNALKFSPPGGAVTLRLGLENNNSAAVLEVEDEGPGIPGGEERRIFRLFHRAGSELRRETPGVGIGLAIVRHVARAHRGAVRAENVTSPDKSKTGARFSLILPNRP